MSPYTDMLTYSSGVYSRTQEAFKFQGNHIFKVLGWETSPDGGSYWIVENTWGTDWGEGGYGKIASGGETSLDFYALSFAMYPKTMAEAYAEQMASQTISMDQFSNFDSLEDDISEIFMDEIEESDVIEEGIDQDL